MTGFDWTISQWSAREHYAVARALARRNRLKVIYTDAWRPAPAPLLRMLGGRGVALANRYHPGIPRDRIVALNAASIWISLRTPRHAGPPRAAEFLRYFDEGRWYGSRIERLLARQKLDPASDAFFSYSTGALEPLKHLASRGVLTVVDQIDPARTEEEMVEAESQRWPGWQLHAGAIPNEYFARLEAEWHAASLVLVNSKWSRDALVAQGVAEAKLIVVPLAFEPPAAPARTANRAQPLKVLWLGSVNLRKGIQYLIQAARLLQATSIRFEVAGPIGISEQAVASATPNVTFTGPVSRDKAASTYAAADVFLLPTISDGFALTQLEAMAYGLPVITTPNCGEVVTHGSDGWIVPPRDAGALASAITKLDEDRTLLAEMSKQATAKSRMFTLDRFADSLQAEAIRASSSPARK